MSDEHERIASLSQEGYRLLRENRVSEAEEHFSLILDEEPYNSYALVGMGDAARKRRDPGSSVQFYERCLTSEPENGFALFGLADALRLQRKYTKAVEVWERYLQHDDQNVTVLTRVADGYRKLRNKKRSRELYEQVLAIEPENPYALIGLGHVHYDHREYEQALQHWMRMMALSGARVDIRVLTSIGNCYRKLKRFAEGIRYFEQALDQEEGNFYALFGLADCYRGMHEAEKSLEYWQKILKNDPDNRVILTRAGDAYRVLGELDEAVRCYRKALSIDSDVYAQLGLAIVDHLRGDLFKATAALEELAEQNPKNSRIAIELAQAYEKDGEINKAVATLARYAASGEENAYVEELLGRYRSS